MALPVTIPNEFANATASIPLSQLDTNFSTLANAVNGLNSGSETLANLKATTANVGVLTVTGNATIGDASTDTVTLNSTLTANTAVIFAAGTSAAPSITTTGDTNTGIFFPAADTIAFAEGGAEAMRIDSSGTITYTQTTLANYQWTSWNPSDNSGTTTTAPNTGTTDDSNYVTMSNSSGTLTITFDVAGKYLISLTQQTTHGGTYTYETFYFNLGGTATRRIGPASLSNWGEPTNDGDTSITTSFYVSATASQTLTVQPQYRISSANAANLFTAYANATILYCGG